MEQKNLPIAVFDSGVGGISVLKELVRLLPKEHFVYFGDSANAPYGLRSTEDVRRLTLGHMAAFYQKGIKAMVIACNTATSAAIHELRILYPDIPVIGIEPALKPAVARHPGGKILVMATQTTLREEKFARLMKQYCDTCTIVPLPGSGLVEYVERGVPDSPEAEQAVRALLTPALICNTDAIVLGCTHFPFLKPIIRRVIGDRPELLDGSVGTAKETARQLALRELLRTDGEGCVELRNSLGTPEILALSAKLLES